MKQFQTYGPQYGATPALIRAVMKNESGGNPNVPRGSSGEVGIMQLKPEFGSEKDRSNPDTAIRIAAQALGGYMKKYKNNAAAMAAYNMGPGNYEKWVAPAGPPQSKKWWDALQRYQTRRVALSEREGRPVQGDPVMYVMRGLASINMQRGGD